MSCVITSGYSKGCDIPAGIRSLIFINYEDINTITRTYNNITALTLDSGKEAYRFNVERGVTTFEENSLGTTENGSVGYEQKLTTKLHGNSSTLLTLVDALHTGRFAVIAENNDGTYELFFEDRGAKFSVKRINEANYEGFNGFELTATHKQALIHPTISSDVIGSLPIGGNS